MPAVAQHKVHADAMFIDAVDGALLGEVHRHEAHSLGEIKAKVIQDLYGRYWR